MTGWQHRILRRLRSAVSRLARYRFVFTGRPLVVRAPRHVVKIVLRRSAANHLAHEVMIARRALTWRPFVGHVIDQRLVNRFVATSRLRRPDGSHTDKVKAMVQFLVGRLSEADRAPRVSARSTLVKQMENLRIERCRRPELLERYRVALASRLFDFQVPQTPMHGDFAPQNAVLQRNELWLADWEYASDCGTLLYDVWFLRRSIIRDRARLGATDAWVQGYVDVLEGFARNMDLNLDQFDALGHALHALVDFSRLVTRGEDDRVLSYSIGELERLARAAELGAVG